MGARAWTLLGAAIIASLPSACAAPRSPASACGSRAPAAIVNSQHGYLLLADGSIHFASEGEATGCFVAGVIEAGRFIPEGDVLGDGPADESGNGTPGWLELQSGSFRPRDGAEEGLRPCVPCIEGVMTADGVFVPSSRQVVY